MKRFAGKKITLLVTGSIAAYKSAELVREFVREGATVQVALTEGAAKFITPLTLQTLSNRPVATSLFSLEEESQIGHIKLADEPDVVVLAPASATTLAKAAHGIADNTVTAVLLATTAPVVCAPAMNVNMWSHPATVENCRKLAEWGWRFVEPAVGELACGWHGQGRLAEIGEIVFAVERAVTEQDLRGERIVITAGATREFLDPVRCMTNRSSGKMGYALAERAALRGADVVLLSGPTGITPPLGVRVTPFVTALELRQALHDTLEREEDTEKGQKTVLIMAAAVTDFRPEVQSVTKLKQSKSVEQTLTLVPNPDLLKELGEWRAQPSDSVALTLVGFAAETGTDEEILRYAQEKMERKKVDLLVANRVEEGFERDENRVWILSRAGSVRELPSAQKRVIADGILDAVVQWKGRKG